MKKIYVPILTFLFLFSSKGNAQAAHSLDVVVYGMPSNSNEINATGYSINGEVQEYAGWTGNPSIHIAILDSTYCLPINTCNLDFGQANIYSDPDGDCITDANTYHSNPGRARWENYFIYRSNDALQMQSMAHLLDSVENGNFILAYIWFPSAYSTMDTSFRNVFQRLGSLLIPTLPDNLPFIFFCKKGDQGSVVETSGTAANSLITLHTTYQCSPTGVNEINSNNVFSVFPNPATEKFEIRNLKLGAAITIMIYDVIGNVVQSEIINPNSEMIIDARALPTGFYFVKVTGADYNACGKVCVVRE